MLSTLSSVPFVIYRRDCGWRRKPWQAPRCVKELTCILGNWRGEWQAVELPAGLHNANEEQARGNIPRECFVVNILLLMHVIATSFLFCNDTRDTIPWRRGSQ